MSNVDEIRQQFKKLKTSAEIKNFLDIRAQRHKNYFHYTNVDALKGMLKSKKLYLSLGKTMNDLFEPQKIDPLRWARLYVASFSFTANESVALWHIYGNRLNRAIRIQFSKAAILKVLETLRNNLTCRSVGDQELRCNIKNANLVDVAYVQNNQSSLRWNKALLSQDICLDLPHIHEEMLLAGYIKNIAWEYEMETRFLVELEPAKRIDKFPDKIQIDAEELWRGAKILCGPCLPMEKFKAEMEQFFTATPSAIGLNLECGKNLENSILLDRVIFKTKCKKCRLRKKCQLLLRMGGLHA